MQPSRTVTTAFLISYLGLIVVVLILAFESDVTQFYYRIKYKSPVEFNNIRIAFPKGIGYNADEESIVFFHCNALDAHLVIGKINLNKATKENLSRFLSKKEFHILDTKDIQFKEYPSIFISYVDTLWRYNEERYIIPKNLEITYIGTRKNYNTYFKEIIESMEFLGNEKTKVPDLES